MRKTTLFRQLIEAEEILVQPGVYDGFSARLIQQMGFKSGSISGAGLSESTLGWADVGILSYEANVSRSRDIAACVDIPLSADADTGYGNAVNVFFTVRGFEAAGVDGIITTAVDELVAWLAPLKAAINATIGAAGGI